MKPTEPGLPVFCMRALDETASEFARQAWVKDICETKEAIGTCVFFCCLACRRKKAPTSAARFRHRSSLGTTVFWQIDGRACAVRKRRFETAPPTFDDDDGLVDHRR